MSGPDSRVRVLYRSPPGLCNFLDGQITLLNQKYCFKGMNEGFCVRPDCCMPVFREANFMQGLRVKSWPQMQEVIQLLHTHGCAHGYTAQDLTNAWYGKWLC